MKKIEMAKQAMYKTVLKVLDDNKNIWDAFEPFHTEVGELRSLSAGIEADVKAQTETASGGYTGQKSRAYDDMLEATYKLARRLKAWSAKQKNDIVYKAVNFSRSGLAAGTEAEQIARCRLVLDKAEENKDVLKGYRITADFLARVEAIISKVASLDVDKDVAGTAHQASTGSISDKVKRAKKVLEILDDLVEGFIEEEHASFADKYSAARKTQYYRGGSKKDNKKVGDQ